MKIKQIIFLLLITTVVRGQIAPEKFEKFANKQDSLFTLAYERQDVKTYNKLLNEFVSQYSKLSADDKNNFADYLSGAYYNFSCTYSLLNNKPMALTYLKK